MKAIRWFLVPLLLWGVAFACSRQTGQPSNLGIRPQALEGGGVGDAGVSGSAGAGGGGPSAAGASGAGGGACSGLPLVALDGSESGGAASGEGLPVCESAYFPDAIAACTAEGWFYHFQTRTCVDECLAPESLTPNQVCCGIGPGGLCCQNGVTATGTCRPPPPPGPGGGSSPPCPRSQPYYKCNSVHRCRCSANP